jgi:hypothetical protein
MHIVILKKAAPLGEIVGQVYALEGQKAASQQAEAALRGANPHLADLQTVPEGTVIVVPDKEGLRPSGSSEPLLPLAAGFEQLTGVLRTSGASLVAAHDKGIEEAKATVARAKSKDFVKLIDTDELKATVAETVKNAQARIKTVETARGQLEKKLKQAGADLDDLQRRFAGSAPPKVVT